MESQIVLRAEHISKRFGVVKALDDVSFDLMQGEVHALVGANGAGKSTLIKVLTGFHRPDSGRILLAGGREPAFHSPADSIQMGVSCVHQEIDVARDLTVAQNIFLGNDRQFSRFGVISHKAMAAAARAILDSLGLDIGTEDPVGGLSFSQMQMIMIANALAKGARILIFDEPTSSLSKNEIEHLFREIERLKQRGISIIYISHHMDEVFHLADRASVLREGRCVGTVDMREATVETLVQMMIGRAVRRTERRAGSDTGQCVLEVKDLSTTDGRVNGVNLRLNRGQVIGLYGIVGAGRTELAKAIFTGKHIRSGTVSVNGAPVKIRNERDAIRHSIVYSSEARKAEGLLLNLSVQQNISITVLDRISRWTVINRRREAALADQYIEKMGIVTPGKHAAVGTLSGGNQQKVVISRWFATDSQVMIFDEPTIGIDIAAKQDVLNIIRESAQNGKSIIVISSEMEELFDVCDQIYVMRMGRVERVFRPGQFCSREVMAAATGGIVNG